MDTCTQTDKSKIYANSIPYTHHNAEVMRHLHDVRADLEIAGDAVYNRSETCEYWRTAYMISSVALDTLDKLVAAERLTQDEVDGMIAGRKEQYGY